MPIRPARPSDAVELQDIERGAGTRFRSIGMDRVADDPPAPLDELRGYIEAERAWVYAEGDGRPVAYLLLDVVDGDAHIEQVSVVPAYGHRGVGRALIEHVAAVAVARGLRALTLTTFRDVPWNAPYYERLGFETFDNDAAGPGLREVLARESHLVGPRVCMRRKLMGNHR